MRTFAVLEVHVRGRSNHASQRERLEAEVEDHPTQAGAAVARFTVLGDQFPRRFISPMGFVIEFTCNRGARHPSARNPQPDGSIVPFYVTWMKDLSLLQGSQAVRLNNKLESFTYSGEEL